MVRIIRIAPLGSDSLSLSEARRLAVQAQGFSADRDAEPSRGAAVRAIKRVGLLQLDSVNVLVRSHYLPLYSRLGPYQTKSLDRLSQRKPRALFEYWGHEASLIPVEYHALFRWRMDRARQGRGMWAGPSRIAKERPDFVGAVLNEVKERGPIGARELSEGGKSTGAWWGWSDGKRALEYLFWTGQVTSAGRLRFERLYDLPERVLPAKCLGEPLIDEATAQRGLIELASAACAVASEADLRDYFRLSAADAKARIAELKEAGVLRSVAVEGWKQQAFIHHAAKAARASPIQALLSPFDSLIWTRPRTERLFGFHYRLAFYTPRRKRKQGYYVMPFLLGDRLVARVDLKSDREKGRLLVLGGHAEPGAALESLVPQLKSELNRISGWLGLDRMTAIGRGELVRALRRR